MDFTVTQWIWLAAAAFAVGISKMGLSAVFMLFIPIIAGIFGGKESTGLILPLLMVGDVFAVIYYKHHIQIQEIRQLLAWACVGILIGMLAGQFINDAQFKSCAFRLCCDLPGGYGLCGGEGQTVHSAQ